LTIFPNDKNQQAVDTRTARMKGVLELAFVGDAVYELFVRDYISSSVDTSPGKLHSLAVGYVKAEAQAKALEMLLPMLLDEEKDIVRRGKNSSKMSVPKHADPKDYRSATALEALFGYLYILRRWDRLEELFQAVVRQNPIEY